MKAPKRMSSGGYIDLADFTADDVSIDDIEKSLNLIYRFTGHYKDKKPLTVAQHTLLVMKMAEMVFPDEKDVMLDCLLHDMPEAYYGDVATPWKKLLGENLKKAQDTIDEEVYKALWHLPEPFTEEVYTKRKVCDLLALDIERRNIWKSQKGKDLWPETPNVLDLKLQDKEELFDFYQGKDYVPLKELWEGFDDWA